MRSPEAPRLLPFLAAVCLIAAAGCGDRAAGPQADRLIPVVNQEYGAPDEMIVELAAGWSAAEIDDSWDTTTLASLPGSAFTLFRIPSRWTFAEIARDLIEAGAAVTVEPNYYVATPESQQGSIAFYEGSLQTSDVTDQQAMLLAGTPRGNVGPKGAGITIAILDTGIDATHPDLAAVVRSDGWDFVGLDDDPRDEMDGVDQDFDGAVDEAAGHGTHVAGIAHFVAPQAALLPVRVLDSEGNGTIFGVAQGVDYARTAGARVINLSLALDGHSTVGEYAIQRAHADGILVVSSVGNDGTETGDHFPAGMAEVLGVAAVNGADLKASFSNYGPVAGLSAPGVDIASTYLLHGYATWSGTSMAAPFVSGTAALVFRMSPRATPEAVRAVIEASSTPMNHAGYAYQGQMGAGRINVRGAILGDGIEL